MKKEDKDVTMGLVTAVIVMTWVFWLLWQYLFGAFPGAVYVNGRWLLMCGNELIPVNYNDKNDRPIKGDENDRTDREKQFKPTDRKGIAGG